jgi:cytochrome c biogenesis protein ResB
MLYKWLSSLKASVYILSVMGLIFLVGTIFPQGENIEDYIEAGGKYVAVVRALDFLDIFMSPLFLFTTAVLLVNLSVCLYDRFRLFLKIKRKPREFQSL